jgi:hypothetical protein
VKLLSAALLIAFVAQQKNANSDLKYDEKAGISVSKPPKNDEWDFKDKGMFDQSRIVLAHKVDELTFDIVQHPAPPAGQVYDLKKQVEGDYTNMNGQPGITEAKRIAMNATKLPGSGVQAWYLEMTFKRSDKLMEYREWTFIGRENQLLYMVALHGEEGMYKKHQKVADFILGSIKTWKLPKQ